NQIEKATGLESLKTLQNLDLSSNKITSLRGLGGHDLLEMINLEDNQVPHFTSTSASPNSAEDIYIFLIKFLWEIKKRSKNLTMLQEMNIRKYYTFSFGTHLQDLIQGTGDSFSLTVFRLTFKGTSVAPDRKLPNNKLVISINNTNSRASYSFPCSFQHVNAINFTSSKFASLNDVIETVAELPELKWIEDLPLLRVLNLLKNPLQERADYWLSAIFTLLQLTELDLEKIPVEEKVAAVNKYDPPPEVVAAEDHRTQVVKHMMQPQRVLHSTLPGPDASYPMLVLVGPVCCGKRKLTHKICRQFNNFFRYGPCHTTRRAYFGEENRLDYYFMSPEAFEEMVNSGKFIATYKYSGYCYGLGRDTVESIAREGLGTCVHLEIEGVRSLKCTYFKPRYILVVPTDKENYEEHLRRTGLFSRPEIKEAVSRVDMYLKISQDFPGYFDAVINTGEL
ncbi:LRGUK protein, partial [Pachyramphus minor]|nr:LRGUK protein [Pachyramphus minor]